MKKDPLLWEVSLVFIIVLCKGSYGVPVVWRCDENRWYSNERELHSVILGIVGLEIKINM